jgi:hypothetical protein
MKKAVWLVLTSVALWACNNNAITKGEETDTIAEAPDFTADETMVREAFPEFYGKLKAQDASFNPNRFQESEGGTTEPVPGRFFPPEELEPFLPYLVYNSDSSQAIDLVSYNYMLTSKNGQSALEPTGPDTEVAVIDLKSNMRTRIFFSGPGTTINQGKWLDSTTVLLAGAENVSSTAIKPLLLRIDFMKHTLQRFTYTDSLKAQLREYSNREVINNQ